MSITIITRKDSEADKVEQFDDKRIKEVYLISFTEHFYNNIIAKGYLAFDSEKLLAIENSIARSVWTMIEKWRGYELYLKRPVFFIARRIPLKWDKKNIGRTVKIIEKALDDLKSQKLIKHFTIIKEKIPLRMQWNRRRAVRARGKPHGMGMENYLPLLQSTSLFAGLEAEALRVLLGEVGAVLRTYSRGETLVLAGQTNRRVGVVLSGELEAYRPGPEGARVPITRVEPGGVFGDVLGGSSLASPVTVLAATACEVLLVPYEKLLLPGADPARQRVLQNLVRTISDKYFSLSRRIDLLVMKSLRAKVAAYLLSEAARAHSLTFSIPFSRIQLADYLNCDRSALSRELSTMQKEGLIDTYRSSFKLLEPDALQQMVQ